MKNRKRTTSIIVSSLVVFLVGGLLIIKLNYYRGTPKLIAGKESGICYIELFLKDNNTFYEQIDCLIKESTIGNYVVSNDTIYFEGYKNSKKAYRFGLIESNDYEREVLNLYNGQGVIETQLSIQLNELME